MTDSLERSEQVLDLLEVLGELCRQVALQADPDLLARYSVLIRGIEGCLKDNLALSERNP